MVRLGAAGGSAGAGGDDGDGRSSRSRQPPAAHPHRLRPLASLPHAVRALQGNPGAGGAAGRGELGAALTCAPPCPQNAMRATVESHESSPRLPPVRVMVALGQEDLAIKVRGDTGPAGDPEPRRVSRSGVVTPRHLLQMSDRGLGVPLRKIDRLFSYMYSTAPTPPLGDGGAPLVRASVSRCHGLCGALGDKSAFQGGRGTFGGGWSGRARFELDMGTYGHPKMSPSVAWRHLGGAMGTRGWHGDICGRQGTFGSDMVTAGSGTRTLVGTRSTAGALTQPLCPPGRFWLRAAHLPPLRPVLPGGPAALLHGGLWHRRAHLPEGGCLPGGPQRRGRRALPPPCLPRPCPRTRWSDSPCTTSPRGGTTRPARTGGTGAYPAPSPRTPPPTASRRPPRAGSPEPRGPREHGAVPAPQLCLSWLLGSLGNV